MHRQKECLILQKIVLPIVHHTLLSYNRGTNVVSKSSSPSEIVNSIISPVSDAKEKLNKAIISISVINTLCLSAPVESTSESSPVKIWLVKPLYAEKSLNLPPP